jgi:group I intron endonuclease
VLKHGWSNFQFGILEYINTTFINCEDDDNIKNILLKREQYYLNSINPSLNICKIAGSSLGIKHGISFSRNLSNAIRGRKNKVNINKVSISKVNVVPKVIKPETILKLSCRSSGLKVKLFDQSGNLINQFPSVMSVAEYLGVSDRTVRRILNTGISYDNFTYVFEIANENPISVRDKKNNIDKEYYSINALSKDLTISPYIIKKLINTNKLYKDRYIISRY